MGQPTRYPRGMSYPVGVLLTVVIGVAVYSVLYFPIFHRTHADAALVVGVLVGVLVSLGVLTRSRAR